MEKQNKNIINIIKTKKIALAIMSIIQLFSLPLLNVLINEFTENQTIKIVVPILLIVLCIIIDLYFYKLHISRAKYFLSVKPIECKIEDFILISYGYSEDARGFRRKDYRLYPVVNVNNELFFTYGDYSISYYNAKHTRLNNIYTNYEIFRKDHSNVEIGDTAYLYTKKKIDIKVEIDVENNKFKLNKQKETFNNVNKKYDINVLKKLNFFEGIIDIEYME